MLSSRNWSFVTFDTWSEVPSLSDERSIDRQLSWWTVARMCDLYYYYSLSFCLFFFSHKCHRLFLTRVTFGSAREKWKTRVRDCFPPPISPRLAMHDSELGRCDGDERARHGSCTCNFFSIRVMMEVLKVYPALRHAHTHAYCAFRREPWTPKVLDSLDSQWHFLRLPSRHLNWGRSIPDVELWKSGDLVIRDAIML